MRAFLLVFAMIAAGCTPAKPGEAGLGELKPVDSVSFELSACYGTCPVFALTIDTKGNGTFEGKRFVAQKGKHAFKASQEQLAGFLGRIGRFRSTGAKRHDYQTCSTPVATDNPSVSVSWSHQGAVDSLFWYLGCDEPALTAIEPDLYNAWQELPLDSLVGREDNRFVYERGSE